MNFNFLPLARAPAPPLLFPKQDNPIFSEESFTDFSRCGNGSYHITNLGPLMPCRNAPCTFDPKETTPVFTVNDMRRIPFGSQSDDSDLPEKNPVLVRQNATISLREGD